MSFSKIGAVVLKMIARNRVSVAVSLAVVSGLIAWSTCCVGPSRRVSAPTPVLPSGSHSVVVSWTASSSASVRAYNVYRSSTTGGPYKLVGLGVSGTIFTDKTVSGGVTYFYVVTSISTSGVESVKSREIKATVPSP